MNSFVIMGVLFAVALLTTAAYILPRRKQVDEMHGMMAGMVLGMCAGLVTATLFLLPTGNFLWGTILGSIVGLIFGIPFGKLGGHLGLVEGVMAGPMGGMMGAMLGQMMRPFNIDIFMPFFAGIILLSLLSVAYAVHCGVSCCAGQKKKPDEVSQTFVFSWIIGGIVIIGASIILSFSLVEASAVEKSASSYLNLPPAFQQKEVSAEAVLQGDIQVVQLVIENSGYSPNVINAKAGVPLKIEVSAKNTAGCASEIVIPDFKIKKIVAPGTSSVIDLPAMSAGTYQFTCSMDMARGKIIVR